MSKVIDMPTVTEISAAVSKACLAYPVKRAYLFGSYARGEQTPTSDVDLFIEMYPDAQLDGLTLGGMYCELEDAIGISIDVITSRPSYLAETKPRLFRHIEDDKVLLYERH